MNDQELKTLIEKYEQGLCTEEERIFLLNWFNRFSDGKPAPGEMAHFLDAKKDMWGHIVKRNNVKSNFPLFAAAVLTAVILAVGIVLFIRKPDVPPGRNLAYLTLSTGKKIYLDDFQDQQIKDPYGATIKTSKGEITYVGVPAAAAAEHFNTISTPNGGSFKVILEDGTQVWLNAGSTLTYPIKFNSERRVTLTGEGYFEVAKDTKRQFFVETKLLSTQNRQIHQTIRVTGTHFNVSCFSTIRTTLEEGSVVVTSDNFSASLKPGQQSVLDPAGIKVNQISNASDFSTWRSGMQVFTGIPLTEVLASLSKWYDIEIDYSNIPDTKVYAIIPRNVPLSQVLKLIETSKQINFSLSGRRLSLRK